MSRRLRGLALTLAENALKGVANEALKEQSLVASLLPPPPDAPMIAPVDERQPDAFVFLGLCLSIAIPAGMLLRAFEDAAEESNWSEIFSYERVPVWLLASYVFSASAFGELFVHGQTASALHSTHYALSSCSMLCAMRHLHKTGNVSRRASGAIMLSFVIGFSVVLFFRTSLHTEHCKSTMMILTAFCAAPCWRVYSARRRAAGAADPAASKAQFRGRLAHFILVLEFALQPWLGVCMAPASWAEPVQMGGELAVLALATESLWAP